MGVLNKRTSIWIVAVGVLAVAVLGFFLLREKDTGEISSVEGASLIGQMAEVDGVQISVIRSYESRGTDSERPKPQYIYTLARFSLTNNSGQQIVIKPEDFTLLLNNTVIPEKLLGYVMDAFITQKSLEKDGTFEGVVTWETPIKYKDKYLVYHSPTGKTITVDLLKTVE